MTTVDTFWARIYLGLREGYTGPEHSLKEVEEACQQFCTEVGLCVTVTPTHFFYAGGGEPGALIELINYPRFPKEMPGVKALALTLAERLRDQFGQYRVSVMFPDQTVMLGEQS